MAEEQRYEQSNAPTLCANNCGFFGNPGTLNLCSKCFRDHRLKEQQSHQMEALLSSTATATATAKPSFIASSSSPAPDLVVYQESAASVSAAEAVPADPAASGPSRCGACRKRVGLTGFKCRCGSMYCGVHRYPEQHSCSFDFKASGKEAIAKANPVIKAAKLDNKI